MTHRYNHTQIGYLLITAYCAVIIFLGYMMFVSGLNAIALIVLLVMLIVLCLFATLTVTVDNQTLRIHFGVGLIRKRFLLSDIEEYRAVKNPWYYGWGIRYTPRGWLFNVSGFSAIELQMKSGRTYRIGTDEPDSLLEALSQSVSGSPAH